MIEKPQSETAKFPANSSSRVESRIRLSSESPASELSNEPGPIEKLSYLLRCADPSQLLHTLDVARATNRQLFLKYVRQLGEV